MALFYCYKIMCVNNSLSSPLLNSTLPSPSLPYPSQIQQSFFFFFFALLHNMIKEICVCILRKNSHSQQEEVAGFFLPWLQQHSHLAPEYPMGGNCMLLTSCGYLVSPCFTLLWESTESVTFIETTQDFNQNEISSHCADFASASTHCLLFTESTALHFFSFCCSLNLLLSA